MIVVSRRSIRGLAGLALCLGLGATVARDSALSAESGAVIVVVRTDQLAPGELGGDAEIAPSLRALTRSGTTLARVELDRGTQDADLQQRLIPPELSKLLEDEGVRRVSIESYPRPTAAAISAAVALTALKNRFGSPRPRSDEERALTREVREVLELEDAVIAGDEGRDVGPRAAPRGIEAQVRAALKSGVGLVVVTEASSPPDFAPDSGDLPDADTEASPDAPVLPGRAGRRDALLGKLLSIHAGGDVTLAVLSVSTPRGENRASFVVAGPKIRRGWISTPTVSLKSLGATLIYLLEPGLLSQELQREVIVDLFKD